jgi:large subunit ribosomal protein L2
MALKTFNPTSPGRRQLVLVDRSGLHKGGPVKALTEGKNSSGGRNNLGRRTARWRGGGAKKSYRIIDFKRRKWNVPATVERLEYDPNRTAFIALIKYADGELAYIIAPQRVDAGDTVIAGENVDIKPGNALPLKGIPVGTLAIGEAGAANAGILAASMLANNDAALLKRLDAYRQAQTDAVAESVDDAE